jgi:hypothetical protein
MWGLVGKAVAARVGAIGPRALAVSLQVEPGAEASAGASDDDRAARAVRREHRQFAVQGVAQCRGHRVQPVGSIEGEQVDLGGNPLAQEHFVGHGNRLSSGGRF